jgi:hypothetical protein
VTNCRSHLGVAGAIMPRDYYVDHRNERAQYSSSRYSDQRSQVQADAHYASGRNVSGNTGYEHIDPELDARNYRDREIRDRKLTKSDGRSSKDGQSKSRKDADYRKSKHKKSKHKKHSKDSEKRREKNQTPVALSKSLVEYDEISSDSEDMYSSESQSSHARSRVTPDKEKGRREPSPGSAIKAYKKHISERSHSNSPVSSHREKLSKQDRDQKYAAKEKTSSSRSHKREVVESEGRSSSNSGNAAKTDAPKAYPEPPKAYRGSDSPSPKKARYRSRSPSPYSKTSQRFDFSNRFSLDLYIL